MGQKVGNLLLKQKQTSPGRREWEGESAARSEVGTLTCSSQGYLRYINYEYAISQEATAKISRNVSDEKLSISD